MAKTPMSDEQRKATSERMKARWAERKAATNTKTPETQKEQLNTTFGPEPAKDLVTGNAASILSDFQDTMSGPQPETAPSMPTLDYGDVQRLVDEMVQKKLQELGSAPQPQQFNPWAQPQGPHVGANGSLVGVREKYIIDPKRYPDPRGRLAVEPRLQRFAFTDNYDMEWDVAVTQYKTIDGVNTREPKFTLKLRRIMFNEDSGLATNQRYVVCQAIFHEDPEAALAIAHDAGYEVTDYAEKDFLDEMRYLRMRDWLFEAFYPPKPKIESKKKDMVIGNKVVQVFEINAENAQKMPFDQLDQQKKL